MNEEGVLVAHKQWSTPTYKMRTFVTCRNTIIKGTSTLLETRNRNDIRKKNFQQNLYGHENILLKENFQ